MPTTPVFARRIVIAALASLLGSLGATPAIADDFTVDDSGWSLDAAPGNGTCADTNGKCTLNAAIQEGNFRSGSHTITFAPAVVQVTLAGTLQQLRAPFTITGAFPQRTIINGAGLYSCFDLTDSGEMASGHFDTGANGSVLQNLVIQNCNSDGISANGHGWQFIDNYIGTDPTGTIVVPFGQPFATGNDGDGISVSSSRVYTNQTNDLLQNLFAAIPMQPLESSQINNFATQLDTLLANAMLGPVLIAGNVVSGNELNGIEIFSQNIAGVFVQGNFIGTDSTGNEALPNGESGVRFVGSPWLNMIGPGNVISGNAKHGISNEAGAVALPNFVMGNRIGISATDPSADIGNGESGIFVSSFPETSLDGYVNPSGQAFLIGPFNVISDNKGENNNAFPDEVGNSVQAGVIVTGSSAGVKVIGNTIGLGEFPPGVPLSSTAYGNAGDGIIVTVDGISIGGSGPVDGNVIAANARHGLLIKGSDTHETKVLGNSIGVAPTLGGDLTLGNGVDGVHIDAAGVTTIGGPGDTDLNTIAANRRNGVKLVGGGYQNGWSNLLQRNRIFGNGVSGTGIGIDLDRVANDYNPTGDEIPANYANLDQAAPVICTGAPGEPAACAGASDPAEVGGSTSLEWTLATHGIGPIPTQYRVEFFAIDGPNPNASTSMEFLGEQTVTADELGVLQCPGERCSSSFAGATAGGGVVMTVTDVTQVPGGPNTGWLSAIQCLTINDCFINNTSEFSNAAAPVLEPAPTTTVVTEVNPGAAVFGQAVSVTVEVTATEGLLPPAGTVTVDTGAGSCMAALVPSAMGTTSTGSCLLNAPPVAGSPYTVIASYSGNAQFESSSSANVADGMLAVSPASTMTTVDSHTPNPSFAGAPVAVDVTVAVVAPGGGAPSGLVTVTDGTDSCQITLPATSCNLVLTTVGDRTLTAMYAGDANFLGDDSDGVMHQVDAAGATATSTAVAMVDPGGIVFGEPVTVTVEVMAASGTDEPTGEVVVSAGGSTCMATLGASATPTAIASCILAPPPPVAGSPHTVTASYAGDADFAPSSSAGIADGSLSVTQAFTTTSIVSHTPDPSNVGAPIEVTAIVAVSPPGTGTPTGTITVMSDATDSCQIVLPATSCNLVPTTAGAKTLTASYSGDASFMGSGSIGVPHQVDAGGATATAAAVTNVDPGTAVFGQGVQVTATVTAQNGADEPTGSVQIQAGASSCVALLGASATTTATGACTLSPPPPASGSAYVVTASYTGNATFAASSSAGLADGALTVNQAQTTTSITAHTPNPSFVDGAIAVTVAVAPVAPGAGTPSGMVVVTDGTDSCQITLPATSCNLVPTTTGAKTLVATYGGDANFAGDDSPGVGHTVNPAGSVVTTAAVTLVNPGTIVFGEPVAVTASVTAQSGTDEPTGDVTIAAGASSCVAALGSSATTTATATCDLAPLPGVAGSPYTVTATYGGTATFAASSSSGAGNGALVVNQAATETMIGTHTPNPSNVGAPIAVTATVAVTAPGAGTPTGTITVNDGTENCVIALPATSCNLVPTTPGPKTLTATYGGDSNFASSPSPGVGHTVNPGGTIQTSTEVTLVNPSAAVFGQVVAVTAEVTALSGAVAPNGSVTISAGASSCVGTLQTPAIVTSSATCNLAPPLLPSGGAYTVIATYAGTPTFAPGASSGGGNGALAVAQAATTTSIGTHDPNPSFVLQPFSVSAAVAVTPPGAGTPSGTVTVSDGVDSCQFTLPATACDLVLTTAGPRMLTATYSGDARFLGSASVGAAHTAELLTVFSGPTAVPGVTATATLSGGAPGCTFVDPQFVPVAPLVPPPGVALPFGLFEFTTAGCGAGGTVTVEIVYSEPVPPGAEYWKFGPEPGDAAPHWYTLPGAVLNGATVTFMITDGEIGDDDLLANGTIVDQGGPGTIGTASEIPTASGWALALLALALCGIGWRAARGLGGRG